MLYEVILRQEYFTQEVINRFNYVDDGGVSTVTRSLALITALGLIPDGGGAFPTGTFGQTLRAMQVTATKFMGVSARAIYDVNDFYELVYPSGISGTNALSDGTPPFTAYGFQTNRVRQDIRRGTKRFVGVPEGALGAGGLFVSEYAGYMNTLAQKMTDTITFTEGGSTVTFSPVIVSREEYPTQSGGTAYRYYQTLTEQLEHVANGVVWSAYPNARTQTSRQYGRGG